MLKVKINGYIAWVSLGLGYFVSSFCKTNPSNFLLGYDWVIILNKSATKLSLLGLRERIFESLQLMPTPLGYRFPDVIPIAIGGDRGLRVLWR